MDRPLANSYWVVPGRLLAGEHPAGRVQIPGEVVVAGGLQESADPFRGQLRVGLGQQRLGGRTVGCPGRLLNLSLPLNLPQRLPGEVRAERRQDRAAAGGELRHQDPQLARVGALAGRPEAVDVAREAMRYSCTRQNPDGAWFYGVEPKYHWIDSFHTGYNLDSLKRYVDSTGDGVDADMLESGSPAATDSCRCAMLWGLLAKILVFCR
jgi:hypothetical protein